MTSTATALAGRANPAAGLTEARTHVGELFVFDDSGSFVGKRPYSDRDDIAYWQQVEADYGSGSWITLINDQGKITRKHFLSGYVKILQEAAGCGRSPGGE